MLTFGLLSSLPQSNSGPSAHVWVPLRARAVVFHRGSMARRLHGAGSNHLTLPRPPEHECAACIRVGLIRPRVASLAAFVAGARVGVARSLAARQGARVVGVSF